MANTASAKKRARQNRVRHQLRSRQRSEVRTAVKKVRALSDAPSEAEAEELTQAYRSATSTLDRMSSKGVIPKARAARYKSRLNTAVKKATS